MFLVFITAALLAMSPVGSAQDSSVGKPDPAAIKQAVAALQQARTSKDTAVRIAAIDTAAKIDADDVARQIGRTLYDKQSDVRKAALRALRYMSSKAALDQLLRAKTRMIKDVDLQESYYMALGQHGSTKALPVLVYRAWNPRNRKLLSARVSAIAHIRSPKSVAALVEIETKSSGRRRGRSAVLPGLELLVGIPYPKQRRGGPEVANWWQTVRSAKSVTAEPRGLPAKTLASYKRRWAAPGSGADAPKKGRKKKSGKGKRRRDEQETAARHSRAVQIASCTRTDPVSNSTLVSKTTSSETGST
jgi:HEAT repeats